MTLGRKFALMLGAAVLVGGTGLALAQMDGPPPPDGPMDGLMHHERLSDRLLREFDANHDGKISHGEFNNVLGTRFAAATHGAKQLAPEQFWNIHQANSTRHATAMFRRVDWNADGRLTLEEFAAPQRAHFEMLDRDGTGTVSCASDFEGRAEGPRPGGFRHGHHGFFNRHGRGFGGFGLSRFCGRADSSRDGTVARAELDGMIGKDFAAATNGAATMSLAQFSAAQAARFREMNDRMFKRLDANNDGKLTLTEFAEPEEKLFDRLDRDRDGVITADEMRPRFRDRGRGRDRRGDDAPEHDSD